VTAISTDPRLVPRTRRAATDPPRTPTTVPPASRTASLRRKSEGAGWPPAMVARTAAKTAIPVPSLNRLSPSIIATRGAGAPSIRTRVITAMGSVGERIAPRRKALAQSSPSSRCVTVPMRRTVRATPRVASSEIGTTALRSSPRSSPRAASNTSGGTKTARMSAPPTAFFGSPGTRPMAMPAIASRTG